MTASRQSPRAERRRRFARRNHVLRGVRPGMHVWLGMDWDVAHSAGATFMPVRRHISFELPVSFGFTSNERRNR